jgi:hypothetical protein
MSHILDILSYGLLSVSDFQQSDDLPLYHTVMETLADMLDAKFTPDEVSNSEAAKAVIRELATVAIVSLEQMNPPAER